MDPQKFLTMAHAITAEHGVNLPIDILPLGGSGDMDSMGVTGFNHNEAGTPPVRFGFTSDYVMFMNKHEARDTILHEVAHALVPFEHGHDEVWAAKARELGSRSDGPTYALERQAELDVYLNNIMSDPLNFLLSQITGESNVWTYADPTPWPDNF